MEFAGGATIKGRGGMDAVIVKYDAELNFLWARAVGGSKDDTFERIAVTSAGDIVAVGKISGDVTIDGTDQTLSGTQSTEDRKSTRLNSSHWNKSRMPSSA